MLPGSLVMHFVHYPGWAVMQEAYRLPYKSASDTRHGSCEYNGGCQMIAQRVLIVLVTVLFACSGCIAAQTLFSGDEKTPAYAVILFDGKDLSEWLHSGSDKPAGWKVQDGYMEVRGGDIYTKRQFKDFQIHLEFWLPDMGEAQGQARANSGIYLINAYEIQVLDSYGLVCGTGDCGAIYSYAPPSVNACRPAAHWQTFDVFFSAAKYGADGKKTSNAVVSVLHNGVWIHDCYSIPDSTPGGGSEPKMGPIRIQDHGCPIRYRNIWIRPLDPPKP